jgi:anti-sigma28 factor (negative regulator of flagellin synthesis)
MYIMKITGTPTPDVLAATTKNVREAQPTEAINPSKAAKPEAAPAKPQDSVQISDAARELAGAEAMPADRVSELRQQILSGAYNTAEVVDTVARRILQRGDI